jgi:hypothetical protein
MGGIGTDLLVRAFAKLQPEGAFGVCGFAKLVVGRPDPVVDGDIVDAFVDLSKQCLILGNSRFLLVHLQEQRRNSCARTRRFPKQGLCHCERVRANRCGRLS